MYKAGRIAVLGSGDIGKNIAYFLDRHFGDKSPEVECFRTPEELLRSPGKKDFCTVVIDPLPYIRNGITGHFRQISAACKAADIFALDPWNRKEVRELESQGLCVVLDPLDGGYKRICELVKSG
jgi:hypothetical protein